MHPVCLFRARWVQILIISFITVPAPSIAADSLDFSAEHLIEAQMDARYLALPEIETQTDTRLAPGYRHQPVVVSV